MSNFNSEKGIFALEIFFEQREYIHYKIRWWYSLIFLIFDDRKPFFCIIFYKTYKKAFFSLFFALFFANYLICIFDFTRSNKRLECNTARGLYIRLNYWIC